MKLAVCLHGLARGSSVRADGAWEEKYESLLEFLEPHDFDVFIHSWDLDIGSNLDSIFNPKASVYEPQKLFGEEVRHYSKFKAINSNENGARQGDLFKTLSFLYSRKKAVDLKNYYSNKFKFKYDVVLISRFDVGHHNSGANKTSFLPKFGLPKVKQGEIHQAYWDQTNAGPSDHWFISRDNESQLISNLYNNLKIYLDYNSAYTKACREGWPVSNDANPLSGELFSANPSSAGAIYTNGDSILINNHCLYKWLFMEAGMWNTENMIFHNRELWG